MTLNCIWILKINLLFSSCTRHNTLNRDATVNRLYHILFLLFSTQNETQKHPLKSLCIWFQDFHSSLDENIFLCYIGYYSYYNEIYFTSDNSPSYISSSSSKSFMGCCYFCCCCCLFKLRARTNQGSYILLLATYLSILYRIMLLLLLVVVVVVVAVVLHWFHIPCLTINL